MMDLVKARNIVATYEDCHDMITSNMSEEDVTSLVGYTEAKIEEAIRKVKQHKQLVDHLYQANMDHRPVQDGYVNDRLPDIPKVDDKTKYQHGMQFDLPKEVYGWNWSSTFGRWSAYVEFNDGWVGYTYPESK